MGDISPDTSQDALNVKMLMLLIRSLPYVDTNPDLHRIGGDELQEEIRSFLKGLTPARNERTPLCGSIKELGTGPENDMIGQAIDAYEAKYETKWQDAPRHCQKMWLDAWGKSMEMAINVVETYCVSAGNSVAGEMVAEWTMENLREIRDDLRKMVPNT